MPKFNLGKVLEGTAYGVLNEILAEFRSDDGYALPSRYEVVLLPPQGTRGKPQGALSNIFAKVMQENTGEGTTRKTGLQCNIFDICFVLTSSFPWESENLVFATPSFFNLTNINLPAYLSQ